MKVLITGGTGRSGSEVVKALLQRGADVRVLTRDKHAKLPTKVELSVGDLQDPVTTQAAMQGIDKLFLLVGNVPDELTQALLTLEVARKAKVKHVTYLSVFQAERFVGVPHFIAKHTVETALKTFDTPFTILRPGYFFQNDVALKDALIGAGIFPTPIGTPGVAAVDVRDIAEAAAISLTSEGHAGKTYNIVGSAPISGPGAAAIWADALGRQVNYANLPLDVFEAQMRTMLPSWIALELRMMFQIYQEGWFTPTSADVATLSTLLRRAPRSYEDFVRETAKEWKTKSS